jgi:glycosyltransferase involved in cell wall biosynthesis/uncharacterized UPF0146 family protein
MAKPRLHLVGIFHTQATSEYSHCAFTGKALRFPKMMQAYGYDVIEYSNEGSEAGATEHVPILTRQEFKKFYGDRKKTDFHGDDATVGSEGHQAFEERLIVEMRKRLEPGDIICHPFGHAHQILMEKFPTHHHVETGIGYPTLMPNSFRIFESYAWMHYHQGKEDRQGKNYEWVVPNYFDLDEWDPRYEKGGYLAFLGRICSVKGMDTVKEIAARSSIPVVIAGQGDPSPWEHPNIIYRGPLVGKERSHFLRHAKAALMPTNFTEPFGGSGVEAMLCGTPLIAVDYGAFTETIIDGVTGFRCHTLQDWMDAVEQVDILDRHAVADMTRSRYGLESCGKKYDKIFKDIANLNDKGWYQLRNIDYAELEEEEKPFADRLAHWIHTELKPQKVIDVGCGPGMYVHSLRERGVEAIGYDIDERVKNKLHLYCQDLFSVTDSADTVICLEVAEHIESIRNYEIVDAVYNLIEPGGTLIWTAAKPGQGGVGHINCQEKEYWRSLFVSKGLSEDTRLAEDLRNEMMQGYHMGWFVQNLLVFKNV